DANRQILPELRHRQTLPTKAKPKKQSPGSKATDLLSRTAQIKTLAWRNKPIVIREVIFLDGPIGKMQTLNAGEFSRYPTLIPLHESAEPHVPKLCQHIIRAIKA
ncbi:MAG TPA: hypothetical protein PLS55_08675, partial [Thermogutta sp.]|nr:hypothetical protein [Thermogutta sp.]